MAITLPLKADFSIGGTLVGSITIDACSNLTFTDFSGNTQPPAGYAWKLNLNLHSGAVGQSDLPSSLNIGGHSYDFITGNFISNTKGGGKLHEVPKGGVRIILDTSADWDAGAPPGTE